MNPERPNKDLFRWFVGASGKANTNILEGFKTGNGYKFTLKEVPAIPEPETYTLMLAGLGIVGLMVRQGAKEMGE